MEKYGVIVIGSGPGGYTAAIRSAELGYKTAIVEKEALGGVCLNYGCIPSKSLLKNAEIARLLRGKPQDYGIQFSDLKFDYAKAVERSRKVSKRLNQGVAFLMKKNKIDVLEGAASFKDAHTIEVSLADGSSTYEADHFIIATGTVPIAIKGMEPDGERILNYRQAIVQAELPGSIVIVGGGAIGVEFATLWNAYGAKVTVVEMKDHLLPNESEEAGLELAKSFKKQGINVKTGTSLAGVEKQKSGVQVHLTGPKGDEVVEADQVLIAVGFRPNTSEMDPEKAGVRLNARGWIETDEFGKTSVDHIYAIGDVTGRILLAHAASTMGRIAAEKISGGKVRAMDLNLVPHATFSHPQVASFGLNETTAAEKKRAVGIGKTFFLSNGKALGINENEGWVKLIFDRRDDVLIGATMVGADVCELLPELTLAAVQRLSAGDIIENIHAHPTLSEAIWEAALDYLMKKDASR